MENRTDRIKDRIKDHPLAAAILIASGVLVGVAQVTGALSVLSTWFQSDDPPPVVLTARAINVLPYDSARLTLASTDNGITIQSIRLTFPSSLSRRPDVQLSPPELVADISFQLLELNRALRPKIPDFVPTVGMFCEGSVPVIAEIDYIYGGNRHSARSLYDMDFIQAVSKDRELTSNDYADVKSFRFLRHVNGRELRTEVLDAEWSARLPKLVFD